MPELYQNLFDCRVNKAGSSSREHALNAVPHTQRAAIAQILLRLFPEYSAHYEGSASSERAREVAHGYLSAPSRLRIALSGSLPRTDLGLRFLRGFIGEPSRRDKVVEEVSRLNALARFVWLMTGALSEEVKPVDPEDTLAAFGRLLETPESQAVLIHDRDARDLVQQLFEMLRGWARAGGTPLLSGRYGVTLSFMEIKLSRNELGRSTDGMGTPELRRLWEQNSDGSPTKHLDYIEYANSVWLSYIQPKMHAGECAHIANLIEICHFRDGILSERAPMEVKSGGYQLPPEVLHHVKISFDNRGRKYYSMSLTFAEWVRRFLISVPPSNTLKAYQKAIIASIEADGQAVYEDNLSTVDPNDILPEPVDDSIYNWIPAF